MYENMDKGVKNKDWSHTLISVMSVLLPLTDYFIVHSF